MIAGNIEYNNVQFQWKLNARLDNPDECLPMVALYIEYWKSNSFFNKVFKDFGGEIFKEYTKGEQDHLKKLKQLLEICKRKDIKEQVENILKIKFDEECPTEDVAKEIKKLNEEIKKLLK